MTPLLDGEPSDGRLEGAAVPDHEAAIDTRRAELGDILSRPRVGEDLSDGVLVSAIQGCVLTTLLSALVKTFELVHGTVINSDDFWSHEHMILTLSCLPPSFPSGPTC